MEQENKHNELNKHFHDAFADWEAKAPANGWERVEADLEREGKKRPGAWWWFSGTVLLLLGAGAWYFWPMLTGQKPVQQANSVATIKTAIKKDTIQQTKTVAPVKKDSTTSTAQLQSHDTINTRSVASSPKPVGDVKNTPTVSTTASKHITTIQPKRNTKKDSITNNISFSSTSKIKTANTDKKQPATNTIVKKDTATKSTSKPVITNTIPKQQQTTSTQTKPVKKDSTTKTSTQPNIEESISMSSTKKTDAKKKDSIQTKKDSVIAIVAATAKNRQHCNQKESRLIGSGEKNNSRFCKERFTC